MGEPEANLVISCNYTFSAINVLAKVVIAVVTKKKGCYIAVFFNLFLLKTIFINQELVKY